MIRSFTGLEELQKHVNRGDLFNDYVLIIKRRKCKVFLIASHLF